MAAQRELCTVEPKPPLAGPEIRKLVGRSVVDANHVGPARRDKTVRELHTELLAKIFEAWESQKFRKKYAEFYKEVKVGQERLKTKVDWFCLLPAPNDRCATDSQLFLLAEKTGELGVLVHDFVREAANKTDGLEEVARIVREMRFGGRPLMAKLADNIEGAVDHVQAKYDLDDFTEIS